MTSYRFLRVSLVIVVVSLITSACGSSDDQTQVARALTVDVIKAEALDSYQTLHSVGGLVHARQSTDIGFEESGKIARILVNEGEKVEQGQLLAELDTQLLQQTRQQLMAQQNDILARIELNRSSLQRQYDLKEKGFAADQRIDELTSEEKSLAASLVENDAALTANALRLEKSTLTAPYTSTVRDRLVDNGAVISAGTPAFSLLESDGLEARIGVPVRLLSEFQIGDSLPLTVRGQQIDAPVIAIGGNITPVTLTVQVRLSLQPGIEAVPGEQVFVGITENIVQPGFWVSLESLRDGPRGLWNVFVVNTWNGVPVVQARDVNILYTNSRQAYISGALADGELLIASGLHRVTPGQQVTPREQALVLNTHDISNADGQ